MIEEAVPSWWLRSDRCSESAVLSSNRLVSDRKVMKLARHDTQVRRFMTRTGVRSDPALAFKGND